MYHGFKIPTLRGQYYSRMVVRFLEAVAASDTADEMSNKRLITTGRENVVRNKKNELK